MTATSLTPERLSEIAALCGDARDTFGEVTTQRQLGGPTLFCSEPRCVSEQPCWKHDEPRLQRAYTFGREFMQAIPELLAEVARLRSDLDHATAHDGDHLSKASRRMVDTVMGERDALRARVRDRDARIAALETGLREACDHYSLMFSSWPEDARRGHEIIERRLRALADGVQSQGAT